MSSIRLSAAHASGDGGANRCCRLCGGENNLRSFCTSYLWEGVEERYDQLLYNCFGIEVTSSDCMICEQCVRQLRNIQRFRALVLSAFATAPSEYSTRHSQLSGRSGKRKLKHKKRSNIELSKKTTKSSINKRRSRKSFKSSSEMKRMNIACSMCKQKYPMILPVNDSQVFVCSRCKKKSGPRNTICRKCNMPVPLTMLREHLDLHAASELRGKNRLCIVPKKSQISRTESRLTQMKYYCDQCPKKYALAQHLATHMELAHKKKEDYLCSVCSKEFKTRELLDRHMKMHTGQPIYQCDICLRHFKGKRNFQSHYLTHER